MNGRLPASTPEAQALRIVLADRAKGRTLRLQPPDALGVLAKAANRGIDDDRRGIGRWIELCIGPFVSAAPAGAGQEAKHRLAEPR